TRRSDKRSKKLTWLLFAMKRFRPLKQMFSTRSRRNLKLQTSNETSSAAFSQRRTSSTASADGGVDSGDGESAGRFLYRRSDSAGAVDHKYRCRRGDRIPRLDASVDAGWTRIEGSNILPVELGTR